MILSSFPVFGQGTSSLLIPEDSKNILIKVKQLNQFFNRFNNYENLLTGEQKSDSLLKHQRENLSQFELARKRVLMTLFNHKDSTTLKRKDIVDFINFVSADSNRVKLSYYDTDWFATVKCRMKLFDKNMMITLVMKNIGNAQSGYRWIIQSLKSDLKFESSAITDSLKFISPMNHELGFMDLYNVFNDPKFIMHYVGKKMDSNQSGAILFLIQAGLLKYEKIEAVRYHFLQVDGWTFTVEDFNRSEKNSGWLISDLIRNTSEQKEHYKRKIYFTEP
jgi:hypothetical protein